MRRAKIRGAQGSWEAKASYDDGTESEMLPCVHKHYWRVGPSGPYYDDPWTPDLRKSAKFAKQI